MKGLHVFDGNPLVIVAPCMVLFAVRICGYVQPCPQPRQRSRGVLYPLAVYFSVGRTLQMIRTDGVRHSDIRTVVEVIRICETLNRYRRELSKRPVG